MDHTSISRVRSRQWTRCWVLSCGVLALVMSGLSRADEMPPQATGSASLAALHSDLTFSLVAPPRRDGDGASDPFFAQAHRVVAGLHAAGVALYPEALKRIGKFDVFVADSKDMEALSSATGRIALNAGLADLKPTDDWLAFVLAREMGHVIAGHHASNSAASIATSVLMNLIIPGSGLLRSAVSFAGSQIASASGRERQNLEADEIALKLLEAAGYAPKELALNLALGPRDEQLGRTSWAGAFGASAKALIARVRGAHAPALPVIADLRVAPAAASREVAAAPASRLAPDEVLIRTRPSGMPGPLLLGGYMVQSRRIE